MNEEHWWRGEVAFNKSSKCFVLWGIGRSLWDEMRARAGRIIVRRIIVVFVVFVFYECGGWRGVSRRIGLLVFCVLFPDRVRHFGWFRWFTVCLADTFGVPHNYY